MKEIFFQILDMSVNASLLVLVVIGVRLVLKKAPKYIHCILWAMVALRLICPALPESEASLMPSSVPVSSVVLVEPQTESFTNALPPAQLPQMPIEQVEEQEPQIQWMDILCVVWLVGVATMAGYGAISYLLLRCRVAPSVQQDGVWLCDDVASPFILGVIRPRIYLPSSLDEDCRKSVLAHEKAHLRRKDHWWKPLGFVLLTIHWFNPIMWLAYILLCRDIEAACDERVVKGMEPEERKRYSEALLECAMPRRSIAACPLAFGEQGIKGRIKSVLNYKKPTIWIILATVVALSVVSVCFLTNPNQTLLAYVDVYDNPVISTGRVPEGSYTRYTLTGYEEELEAFEDAMSKKKEWMDLTKHDWCALITYSITLERETIFFNDETYYIESNGDTVFKKNGTKLFFAELTPEEQDLLDKLNVQALSSDEDSLISATKPPADQETGAQSSSPMPDYADDAYLRTVADAAVMEKYHLTNLDDYCITVSRHVTNRSASVRYELQILGHHTYESYSVYFTNNATIGRINGDYGEYARYLPYATQAAYDQAKEKLDKQLKPYGHGSGYYLSIDQEGYLCLTVEIIRTLQTLETNPDGSPIGGCGYDHEHLFFSERICYYE